MYKIIVYYFYLLALFLPNVVLSFTEPFGVAGALTNILLPGGIIYLLMSISPKIGKTVLWLFPIAFFAAFQLVLLYLYGRSVIAVDMFLNLVTTNAGEAGELLGNIWPVIIFVIVIYLPPLVSAIVFIRKKVCLTERFLRPNRIAALVMTVAGIISLAASYLSATPYAAKDDLYPVNIFHNVYLAFDRTVKTSNYDVTSADFAFNAVSDHPADQREVYMIVIGETGRAENWGLLGYDRPTTPRLSSRNDIFVAPKAFSESNTTHKSVPMLLSPVDATDFDEKIYKVKSLVTAFKEAGFSTAFLSNQRYNHSFIDFFAQEADTTVFIKEGDIEASLDLKKIPDSNLLPIVDEILQQGNMKQLIVLHSYGSHFNYIDRYAKEDEVFTPCDYAEATKDNRDKLINAYDNTIVATDRFINDCITRLESIGDVTAGLIYSSDHGEDIYDDNSGRFLHASPRPTIHQVHVPFLVWTSDRYNAENPADSAVISGNMGKIISSTRSLFPSALDMAGITTRGNVRVDTAASVFSAGYTPREPLYLNDHNQAVRLKDIL